MDNRVYKKIDLKENKKQETPVKKEKKQQQANKKTAAKAQSTQKKRVTKAASATVAQKQVASKKKAVTKKSSSKKPQGKKNNYAPPLQIIPLGGLEEIGKNMTLFRCGGDAFIVDCGMAFPDDDMMGIDAVIPDFTYLTEIQSELRGLVLTHGHEDHIGAIPFFLQRFNVPIYATDLTIGLVKNKLEENQLLKGAKLNVIHPGNHFKLGCFSIEFIHMNHSIPNSVALAITTPQGVVIHTGDFKIDYTPVVEKTADLARLGEYGKKGVLALLCDSTNAENPGNSKSESAVGASFEALFSRAEGKRVIIATFSSNIQRIQQIIDFAENHNRKIAVSGRSMVNAVAIAKELGYLRYKENTLIEMEMVNRYKPEELVIITTGSQGEPMSALSRMAAGTHRQVSITANDFIIISATPIPGNEKTVTRVINSLLKLGSDVIYESMYEVHASGHACKNEIKLVLSLVNPQYYMPVHGEYKHLMKNAEIAREMHYDNQHIIISHIGEVTQFSDGEVSVQGEVESGRVLVDGLGVGDVGTAVLRDRQHLSTDGLVVVVCSIDSYSGSLIGRPDIISRGFVYVKEAEDLMEETKDLATEIVESCAGTDRRRRNELKAQLRERIGEMLYQRLKRSPMVLAVVMEI